VDWKELFSKGKEVILSTCSLDCEPNAIVIISLGFIDNKLLIADSQMNTTIKNIKSTKKVCLVSKYYRIRGTAEVFDSGKYFDICNEEDKQYPTKNAILITVENVFDLNKVEEIKM